MPMNSHACIFTGSWSIAHNAPGYSNSVCHSKNYIRIHAHCKHFLIWPFYNFFQTTHLWLHDELMSGWPKCWVLIIHCKNLWHCSCSCLKKVTHKFKLCRLSFLKLAFHFDFHRNFTVDLSCVTLGYHYNRKVTASFRTWWAFKVSNVIMWNASLQPF